MGDFAVHTEVRLAHSTGSRRLCSKHLVSAIAHSLAIGLVCARDFDLEQATHRDGTTGSPKGRFF